LLSGAVLKTKETGSGKDTKMSAGKGALLPFAENVRVEVWSSKNALLQKYMNFLRLQLRVETRTRRMK
jgi:hypothetical protein